MIWRIIKKVLSFVKVTVSFRNGDKVRVRIVLGSHVVLDRIFDVIPEV